MRRGLNDEVSAWAAELPDSSLQCRDFGHSWLPHRIDFRMEDNAFHQTLRCRRCKTERARTVGVNGSLGGSNYAYPDGYTKPAGTGPLDRDGRAALRLVSLQRLIDKDGKGR